MYGDRIQALVQVPASLVASTAGSIRIYFILRLANHAGLTNQLVFGDDHFFHPSEVG